MIDKVVFTLDGPYIIKIMRPKTLLGFHLFIPYFIHFGSWDRPCIYYLYIIVPGLRRERMKERMKRVQ